MEKVLQELDTLLGSIAERAGVEKHCIRLSFHRTIEEPSLCPDVLISMGRLPGLGSEDCVAHGTGESFEDAIVDALRGMGTWRKLSEEEVEAAKRRRARKKEAKLV